MSEKNINSLLFDFIVNQVNSNKWSKVDGKEVINFSCAPMKTHDEIKFSHVKLTVEKINKKYKGSVVFESDLPFMRECEEDEDNIDYDEVNEQTFYTNVYNKLGKCIKKLLELYESITLCKSCNCIVLKDNCCDKSVCSTCLLQIFYQQKNTDEKVCSICLDENACLLPYTLSCDHSFHFGCLAKMRDNKCPLCRKEFKI